VRRYRGSGVWQLTDPSQPALPAMPYVYDAATASAGASYTRSLGTRFKTNLTGGLLWYSSTYTPPADTGLTDAQSAWLAAHALPHSETAGALSVAVQAFDATYKVLRDIATFSLNEDWQLGYSAVLVARWAPPSPLTPQPFAEAGAAARYRLLAADNLLSFSVSATGRRQTPGSPGAFVNLRAAGEILEITPPLGPGRVVARLLGDVRSSDLNHNQFLLGGDDGLRGLPAGALTGTGMLLWNLEYRTRALEFRTLHAGLVFFWDAGTAFTSSPGPVVHTVGAGLRLLLPQFDVETLRIDFGWALNPPTSATGALRDPLSASYGQVEGFRPSFLSSPL
jgi:hypothetical protein